MLDINTLQEIIVSLIKIVFLYLPFLIIYRLLCYYILDK